METYIGILEFLLEDGEYSIHNIVQRDNVLISGTTCNVGLLEEYARIIESHESLDEALQEFAADLEAKDNGHHMSSATFPANELDKRKRAWMLANWTGESFTAPSAWASYFTYGDCGDMEENEIREAELASEGLGDCVEIEDAGFLNRPNYGMAGDCSTFYFNNI